jgi:hypothetical protein
VRGLVINRFVSPFQGVSDGGIELKLLGDNVIEGNFLGTDASGSVALANALGGLAVVNSSNNTIGGTTPGARNLISGNSEEEVMIADDVFPGQIEDASRNLLVGNFIGTDVTGTKSLGNGLGAGFGVLMNAPHNTIGGATAGARNIISGNSSNGVDMSDVDNGFNLVQGNFIGTDRGLYQHGQPHPLEFHFLQHEARDRVDQRRE